MRFSPGISPLPAGIDALRISAPATSRGQAATVARGVPLRHLFVPAVRSFARRKRTRCAARIFVYPLARACPRPAIITSRRKAASAFPALRAPAASEPFPKARRGYFINISLYIIVDTVVFLTPLSGTFEPAAVPKYLPFPGKRNSPRTVSMQGLFFIGSIHDEKRGRATLLFPVQFPAGSSSAHRDDLLGGRQQSHIFPSFMRNPVS